MNARDTAIANAEVINARGAAGVDVEAGTIVFCRVRTPARVTHRCDCGFAEVIHKGLPCDYRFICPRCNKSCSIGELPEVVAAIAALRDHVIVHVLRHDPEAGVIAAMKEQMETCQACGRSARNHIDDLCAGPGGMIAALPHLRAAIDYLDHAPTTSWRGGSISLEATIAELRRLEAALADKGGT